MRLENLAARLRKQSRVHTVQLSLLIIAMFLLLLKPTKFTAFGGRTWLRDFELHLSAVLVLMLLGAMCLRFNQGVKSFQSDWLAVQPIALAPRMAWLRATIAARSAMELLAYSVLVFSLCGATYGLGVLAYGAGLGLITLILLPYWQGLAQAKNARHALVSPELNGYRKQARKVYSATGRAEIVSVEPFTAWFTSAIPRVSQWRWWWLIPLLSLPMSSKIMVIAAIVLGFLALLRFAWVCSAISIGLTQISKLLQTTALRPAKLYRAALIFSAQGVWILALIVMATGLSPAGAGVGIIVGGFGLLLLTTALHFGFGYRLESKSSAVRSRAGLLIALLLGLTANSLPVLVPIVCALLWFWLYQRGARLVDADSLPS